MPLSKDDRLSFSLQIVNADGQIAGITQAKNQLQSQVNILQKNDIANKNLFDPVNILINTYHSEFAMLDGNLRTSIVEQNLLDSANKKIQNFFFPNDTTVTVPSLSSSHNVWPKTKPFALTYCIGKNYTETFNGTTPKEGDLITSILSYITSAMGNTDIQNTTGQSCNASGTCSLTQYTNQSDCLTNGGIWTPGPDIITNDPTIQTLKINLVNAVNSLKTFLLSEVNNIVTNDPNSSNQTLNNSAINNINNVIVPAINAWLAYPDFNTAHGQTTCIGFNSYNSNLLAPTKLHSSQLSTLQSAINSRSSFITTRQSQLNTILGSLSQDLTTGDLTTSSGLYEKRYNFLLLRLNVLSGSLMQLTNLQAASGAQDSMISGIKSNKSTYYSVLPTSILKGPGNGTSSISAVDTSFLSVGDSVYITAEGQEELKRAIKSISGDLIVLNDIVPAKYRPSEKARIYKDLT